MNLYATFIRRADAEGAFASLLASGVSVSDLSVIVPKAVHGAVRQIDLSAGNFESVPEAGFIDPAGEAGFVGVGRGQPQVEAEGATVLESSVGGGISTSRPSDDVSYVEELDDSQEVAGEMLYPESGHSYSDEERRDLALYANKGGIDSANTGPAGIAGSAKAEDTALDSRYQDLSELLVPHLGLVLGDGEVATELVAAVLDKRHTRDPLDLLGPILCRVGGGDAPTEELLTCLKLGGAILVASIPTGNISILDAERQISEHGGVPLSQSIA